MPSRGRQHLDLLCALCLFSGQTFIQLALFSAVLGLYLVLRLVHLMGIDLVFLPAFPIRLTIPLRVP